MMNIMIGKNYDRGNFGGDFDSDNAVIVLMMV